MRDLVPATLPGTGAAIERPHIVHATECLAGGTLALLSVLIGELAQLGVRQTLIYSRRPDTPASLEDQFPPSLQMREVARARGTHLMFITGFGRELLRTVSRVRPSAVHLHSSKAGFVGRLALMRRAHATRLLYSPHGLAFLNRRRRAASSLFYALERVAGRVECTPVGCAASEALLLTRVTGRGAFVLENPVHPSFFDVRRVGTPEPTIVTVGRVCEQKAPERFAELAVRVRVDTPRARFVWVGGGEPDHEALLRAAGVTVTGWVEQDQVQAWLARASIYVQTSRWEGLSMSVIQALAAGLPCVVSDVVGNRDAVDDGRTGFVVQSMDEMAAHVDLLLEQPALRDTMGAAARETARRRFGATRFRQTLIELYGLRAEMTRPAARRGTR